MNHDVAVALSARIKQLREQIHNSERLERHAGIRSFIDGWRKELQACVDTMVGEDPYVRQSIAWFLLAAEDETVEFDGNEHWVFVDIVGEGSWSRKPHCIFRNTGALYRVDSGGAVEDDPIYDPKGVFRK